MSNNENGEQGQIVLYDSPGFTEDKNVIKEFKSLVDKLNNNEINNNYYNNYDI